MNANLADWIPFVDGCIRDLTGCKDAAAASWRATISVSRHFTLAQNYFLDDDGVTARRMIRVALSQKQAPLREEN